MRVLDAARCALLPTHSPPNESSAYQGRGDLFDQVRLRPLMELCPGAAEVSIGLIDGEVDSAIVPGGPGCADPEGVSCGHGSLVASLLVADRSSLVPGICPGVRLVVRPIYPAGRPSADVGELARAIRELLDRGVSLLHLSLAIGRTTPDAERAITAALDEAAARGVLVVASAGNREPPGGSALTRHPWVLLVTASDAEGRPLAPLPAGPGVAARSLRAPGRDVPALGPGGAPRAFHGTSAAAAFVTGAAALLCSLVPTAPAGAVRGALLRAAGRRPRSLVPPVLDAWGAYLALSSEDAHVKERTMQNDETKGALADQPGPVRPAAAPLAVRPQGGPGGCSCGSSDGGGPSVYAIGRVVPRFPTRGIEKECAQVVARSSTAGMTEGQTLHAVLSQRENRYLAREMCFVLTVEGVETYLLAPRYAADVDVLIEVIRPAPKPSDVDVVIGTLGPVAPPSLCNGLELPIVSFDQVYSFDVDRLLSSIPRPEGAAEEGFRATAEELFYRVAQLADNAGATDEHRAINYLVMRYPAIYAATAAAHARGASLSGVEVRPSRLAGARAIVDVIFSYVDRSSDVVDKQFVRVDVSERYPFLVTKLSPFYDR